MAHAQKPDFVFRLKRTSPFKSAGASVQSTTGRRAVHISLQGLYCSCKPVFCSHLTLTAQPTPFACFPFTFPPVRHSVPSHFNWTLMLDTPCSEVQRKSTGYPLHSPVSPSLPLPCVTVCHHVSTGL